MICPTIHLNVTQNVPKLKWWWLRSVKNWCKEKSSIFYRGRQFLPQKKLCRMKIPVMKAIRLCDLALVTDFISSHDLSLVYHLISHTASIKCTSFYLGIPVVNLDRILLLIRDPRGILNSRKPLMTQLDHEGLVKNVMWTCKHNLKNLHDLRQNDLERFLFAVTDR